MDRRMFLGTLAGGLLAAPLAAEVQPAGKVYRIGNLAIAGPTDASPPPLANWESFQQGLRELGYVEGQNIAFEHRYAHGRVDLFPDLAAELVRLPVDIIFARGPQAVTAAKSATRAIPIVGIDLENDWVMTGLVASISRPGGNITGMFLDLAELSAKQLQLLKELVPKLSRVAVLGDPTVNASQLSALNVAGRSLAVQVQVLELRSAERLDGAFQEAKKGARPSSRHTIESTQPRQPVTDRNACNQAKVANDVPLQGARGGAWPDVLRARPAGYARALR